MRSTMKNVYSSPAFFFLYYTKKRKAREFSRRRFPSKDFGERKCALSARRQRAHEGIFERIFLPESPYEKIELRGLAAPRGGWHT